MVPNKFQYPLTRFCLRSGQMTLPQKMLELFPKEGVVKAIDTLNNKEVELDFKPPRTVIGLADFYNGHGLGVNDKVEVKIEENSCYFLTPIKIGRKTDYSSPEVLEKVFENLLEKSVPLSESEIREVFPEIPKSIDLNLILKQDGRFARYEGRWRPRKEKLENLLQSEPQEKIDKAVVENPFSANSSIVKSKTPASELGISSNPSKNENQQRKPKKKESTNEKAARNSMSARGAVRIPHQAAHQTTKTTSIETAKTLILEEEKVPSKSLPRFSFPMNTAPTRANEESGAPLHKRAREAFEKLGYKIKVLSHYQLILQADLGRYNYNVLVCLLFSKQRLDWADLLNSRRKLGTKYLSVFGEHNDLLKIYSSTDLARATLWSWQGIERLKDIAQKVPISPIDLEPHFKSEGLFDEGIASFEEMIYGRISEQGVFSTILSALTSLKSPCVFLLDDIALDVDFPREQLAKVLDTLSQAPFQLLSKVTDGEYNMRSTVSDALLNFSEYALSVRDRLHKRRDTRPTRQPSNLVSR